MTSSMKESGNGVETATLFLTRKIRQRWGRRYSAMVPLIPVIALLTAGPVPALVDVAASPVAGRALDGPFISDPPSGSVLRFQPTYAGSRSSEVRVLVVNASDETLTNISFTRILPESDDFTVTNTEGCDRGTFAPGDFCTLRYAATPGIVSEDLNDEVGLILGSQQFTYFLAGSSLNPFGVAPLALDFGTVPMGFGRGSGCEGDQHQPGSSRKASCGT